MRNNFIGGAWTRGADTRDNINPSDTTDVIGEYAQADAAQTADAITAGADWLVIGRPIYAAENPREAAEAIRESLG